MVQVTVIMQSQCQGAPSLSLLRTTDNCLLNCTIPPIGSWSLLRVIALSHTGGYSVLGLYQWHFCLWVTVLYIRCKNNLFYSCACFPSCIARASIHLTVADALLSALVSALVSAMMMIYTPCDDPSVSLPSNVG